MFRRATIIIHLFILVIANSCTKHKWVGDVNQTGYPNTIGYIMISKCAVSGCHNDESKDAAGGISFSTWDKLFEGGRSGAVVIPYRSDFSTLCYFINTDKSNGPVLSPTMPVNKEPLSKQEYEQIKEWINSGAPNNQNFVKFSDNPGRKKMYVSHFGCDNVAVFDNESMLQMRYVDVGNASTQDFPWQLKVSPDNKFWFVSFFAPNGIIQKFNAQNDKLAGQLDLGPGSWSSMDITSDSKFAFVADNSNGGKLAYINLNTMNLLATIDFGGNFKYPHGLVINNSKKKIYMGAESGNYIYIMDITDPYNPVPTEHIIDGSTVIQYGQSQDPHYFCLTSDEKYCFISCQYSDQVRILDTQTDSVKQVVDLPAIPEAVDIYEAGNLAFISCPEDLISFPGVRGSVIVYNYLTKTIVKKIHTGYEPYALAVDDSTGIVMVANSNLNPGGPAPHHTSACGGRNGYVTFIDIASLSLTGKKIETTTFPRSVACRK